MKKLSKAEIKSITASLNNGVTPDGVFVEIDGFFNLRKNSLIANCWEIIEDAGRKYLVDKTIWRTK